MLKRLTRDSCKKEKLFIFQIQKHKSLKVESMHLLKSKFLKRPSQMFKLDYSNNQYHMLILEKYLLELYMESLHEQRYLKFDSLQ